MKPTNLFYHKELQWAAEAEDLKPELHHKTIPARTIVIPVADPAAWQGWKTAATAAPETVYGRKLPRSWEYVFDFGRLCVGYPVLEFEFTGLYDAPFRLELKMAETPYELARDFSTYCGTLGRGWLQEALLIEDVPRPHLRLERRYAFRYLKLKVTVNSSYKVALRSVSCDTVTAANWQRVTPLGSRYDQLDGAIHQTGLATLAACMQETFEDGPKRDRRLWLGDLRLQALANYASFNNCALVKRCLLMFAAAANSEGGIPGCVYPGSPRPLAGNFTFDYSVLFGDILLDYVQASGDEPTGRELFPVARRQIELALREVRNGCYRFSGGYWLFIDWKDGLERECAAHCLIRYALLRTMELAQRLGLESQMESLAAFAEPMRTAGNRQWFDNASGYFVCGSSRQISWASQIWAAFAGMLPPTETCALLKRTLGNAAAVPPGGPFLQNQMALVLQQYGLHDEAYRLTRSYWGKMVTLGADTFWEVFDPDNPMLSPYGDPIVNSHCHAWSTPVFSYR